MLRLMANGGWQMVAGGWQMVDWNFSTHTLSLTLGPRLLNTSLFSHN
jgi:hypothetical protein